MANDGARPRYEPPTGDEPLDAIEEALVRMWVRIVVREMREHPPLARVRDGDADDDDEPADVAS